MHYLIGVPLIVLFILGVIMFVIGVFGLIVGCAIVWAFTWCLDRFLTYSGIWSLGMRVMKAVGV